MDKEPWQFWDDYCTDLHEQELRRQRIEEQADYDLDMYTFDLEDVNYDQVC